MSQVLTNTDVLAPGSLSGFLTGKHFNRCKHLHPILGLAFEILHFEKFMQIFDEKYELLALLNVMQSKPNDEAWQAVRGASVFTRCVTSYSVFAVETRSGLHGATAQYWMVYIDLIHAFHRLELSIRTNNVELFLQALTPLI